MTNEMIAKKELAQEIMAHAIEKVLKLRFVMKVGRPGDNLKPEIKPGALNILFYPVEDNSANETLDPTAVYIGLRSPALAPDKSKANDSATAGATPAASSAPARLPITGADYSPSNPAVRKLRNGRHTK